MEYNKDQREFYIKEFRRFLVQNGCYSWFIDLMPEDTIEELFDRIERENKHYYFLVTTAFRPKDLKDLMIWEDLHYRWIYFYEKFEESFGAKITFDLPKNRFLK